MEAILKYNLPDEQSEFDEAVNGGTFRYILWELNQHLRSIVKYQSENFSEDYVTACEETREKIFELCRENSVNLD